MLKIIIIIVVIVAIVAYIIKKRMPLNMEADINAMMGNADNNENSVEATVVTDYTEIPNDSVSEINSNEE